MPSSPAGLPYAMHRTAVDSRDTSDLPLVHCLDEKLQVLERRRGQDPMPEVEDVTRPSAGTAEDVTRARAHEVGRPQQHRWIEVALDAAVMAAPLPAGVQRHSPVERHDVGPRGRDRLEKAGGVRAEMN